jgi:hypothetical protein
MQQRHVADLPKIQMQVNGPQGSYVRKPPLLQKVHQKLPIGRALLDLLVQITAFPWIPNGQTRKGKGGNSCQITFY